MDKETSANDIPAIKTDWLILDSGAFISGASFYSLGPDVHYLTTPAVLKEIKDSKSNHFLLTFPYKITTKQPFPESTKFICDFSRESGEYYELSATDIEVLSLAYQIETEQNGESNLKLLPAKTTMEVNWESAKAAALSEAKEDEANESSGEDQKSANGEDDDDESESDDEEGEWITPDNVSKVRNAHMGLSSSCSTSTQQECSNVACITTDFAMQNVMARLGLRLISVGGKSIRRLLFWSLGCYGCRKITSDLSRKFCGFCGGATLTRVSTRIDPVTKETSYRWIQTRKLNSKRGTKYSVPKSRGGRHRDLILREDQLDQERRKRFGDNYKHNKASEKDSFEHAALWGTDAFGKAKASPMDIRYGHERANPNQVRGTKKKNSRNRRRK